MSRKIRWTGLEKDNVAKDWTKFERGDLSASELKASYQGRSTGAIREAARIQMGVPRLTGRKNPVYQAIEARMIALGYGPEVIKSIISPRKAALPAGVVRSIESYISAVPKTGVWFYFTVNEAGVIAATPLRDGQGMVQVEQSAVAA